MNDLIIVKIMIWTWTFSSPADGKAAARSHLCVLAVCLGILCFLLVASISAIVYSEFHFNSLSACQRSIIPHLEQLSHSGLVFIPSGKKVLLVNSKLCLLTAIWESLCILLSLVWSLVCSIFKLMDNKPFNAWWRIRYSKYLLKHTVHFRGIFWQLLSPAISIHFINPLTVIWKCLRQFIFKSKGQFII